MSSSVAQGPRPLRLGLGRLHWQLSLSFAGHSAEIVFGTAAGLMVIGALSPSEYSYFEGALAVLLIAAKLSDMGLDSGLVRSVAKARRAGQEEVEAAVAQAVFVTKLSLAAVVFGAGWLLAPVLADHVFNRSGFVPYLRLAFLGAFGRHLHGFYRNWLAGRLEFSRHAAFVATPPVLLLSGLAVAWALGRLSLPVCLGAMVLAPLLACAAATALLGRTLFHGGFRGIQRLADVWTFSRWTYLTEVFSAVRSKLGTLVLLTLATSTSAGLYAAGDRIASKVTVLTNTLITVLVPRAAHLTTGEELRAYLSKSYRWVALLALGIPAAPVLAWVGRPVVHAVQPDYEAALPLFAVLLVSMLFSVAALPSRSVLYSVHRPQVETAIEVLGLAITLIGYVVLIPEHGAMGAATAMVVQRAITNLLLIVHVHRKVWSDDPGWMAAAADAARG